MDIRNRIFTSHLGATNCIRALKVAMMMWWCNRGVGSK